MFTLTGIIVHVLEGIAITFAIYLVTKKSLNIREMVVLALSVTVTFLILDLFAPAVATGARQGSGFGLGFTQVAGDGNTMPRRFFEPDFKEKIVEGMDDPIAMDYYSKLNPQKENKKTDVKGEPNLIIAKDTKTPETQSTILQEYTKSPFDTIAQYAPVQE